MRRPDLSEPQLAALVVSWLEADGWTVHQEIADILPVPGRLDIAAIKDRMLCVVECKRRLGFDLLAQAKRWLPYANEVFIAVPSLPAVTGKIGKRRFQPREGRALAFSMAASMGIGVLEVRSLWPVEEGRQQAVSVQVASQVSPCREHETLWRALQTDTRKWYDAVAGSPGGGGSTKFNRTCTELAAFAGAKPGEPLDAVLTVIPHHYASIRSGARALWEHFLNGKLRGVELRQDDDGVVRVWPRREDAAE